MRVIQMSAASPKDGMLPKANAPGQIAGEIYLRESENQKGDISFKIKRLLSELGTDDYILAGIILVLIFEGCEDYILLCALGYLFIMGLKV